MNSQTPLSPPISVAGSDRSAGVHPNPLYRSPQHRQQPYGQNSSNSNNLNHNSFKPVLTGRAQLATPPISSGSMNGMNGPYGPGGGMGGPGGGAGGIAGGIGGPPPPRPGEFRGNPSPPSSVGRSSNGTQMSHDAQMRKQSMLEESLGKHYMALKRYLAPTLKDEPTDGRPNRARDKLVRLSPTQFQELSTDVYDELLRRQASQAGTLPPGTPPFLPPRDVFHPKRNQARQKLSALPPPRFRALATDVFFESERRFPRFAAGNFVPNGMNGGSPGMGPPSRSGTPNGMRPGSGARQMTRPPPRQQSLGGQVLAGGGAGAGAGLGGGLGALAGMGDGGPMQKSSQSNTIVPNKSYLVEDDDEADLDSVYANSRRDTHQTSKSASANEKTMAEYQLKIDELQDKLGGLEKRLQEKDGELEKAANQRQNSDNANAEWTRLRENLEEKVHSAQDLNDNLKAEIDRMKSYHSDRERDLREQVDLLSQRSNNGGEWRERFEGLQRTNESLQRDLQDNQRLADEVRREAAGYLSEMKAISDRNDANYEREETLSRQVMRLEDELKEWKGRYAKAKTRARSDDTGSMHIIVQQPRVKDGLVQTNGLIKDISVTRFQVAMDDAIGASRIDEGTALADATKSVVAAVKNIIDEVPGAAGPSDDSSQRRLKLRNRINLTASNFVTAAKNHAAAKGLSPVSLVDAAASHLSTAVVELVHLVRMRPTPAGELEVDDDASIPFPDVAFPEKSSKYFSSNGRSSVTESVYSNQTAAARASQKLSMLPRASYKGPQQQQQQMNVMAPNGVGGGGGRMPSGMINVDNVRERDEDVEDLRLFLDDQNASLVETTQALVSSIRSSAPAPTVLPLVATIAQLLTSILSRADPVLDSNQRLDGEAGPVLQAVAQARSKLMAAEDEGRDCRSEDEWRNVVTRMPPIAFEIAKLMRELRGIVSDAAGGEEDDFR